MNQETAIKTFFYEKTHEDLTLRIAEPADYPQLVEIWLTEPVISYMSFEPHEDFKPIVEEFFQKSKVFVLENSHKTILAVRRVVLEEGYRSHTALLCSLGVNKNYLRQGYGSLMYSELIAYIQQQYPHIIRFEISQDTDNPAAIDLAKKHHFEQEVLFPTGIIRLKGRFAGKWYCAEIYRAWVNHVGYETHSLSSFKPRLPCINSKLLPVTLEEENLLLVTNQ